MGKDGWDLICLWNPMGGRSALVAIFQCKALKLFAHKKYRRCCSAAASGVVRRLHVRLENQAPSAQNSVVAWKKNVKIGTLSLTPIVQQTQRVMQICMLKILKDFKVTIGIRYV